MVLALGSMFGGYRIEAIAGHGASSIVYRAHDARADRVVALKCIREELLVPAERQATVARFHREASIGERLVHPKIVRLYDWGEQDRLPYIAMEFVTGESFQQRIQRTGSVPLPVLIPIIVDILDALGHAHVRSIVHRDIKPANLVLRAADSDPVLMDFGIAWAGRSDLTQVGDQLGSPAFMAPEQIRGEAIDHRVDLFATGIMLYLAATGRRPFDGTSVAEVLHRICYDDPLPPSRLDDEFAPLDPIVATALAKEPGRRYPNAAAFATALKATQSAGPAVDLGETIVYQPAERPRRSVRPDDFVALLATAMRDGITSPLLDQMRTMLASMAAVEPARLQDIFLQQGIVPLSRTLLHGASLADPAAGETNWLAGIELFELLLDATRVGPAAGEAEAIRAELAHGLAASVLVHSSRLTGRLSVDEAPDVASLAADFRAIDRISTALERLHARGEKRLVDVSGRILAAQMLRRAAGVMETYAATRDPLARFDVVNLLVHAEGLVTLAGRLIQPAEGSADRRTDAVAELGNEALSTFLDGVAALVSVSETDLAAALATHDAAEVGDFIGHLKQIRLVYQFVSRFEADIFRDRLADLSQRIYRLFAQITATLTAAPLATAAAEEQATALYEMAEGLGWRELAGRLLERLRRAVLSADATIVSPASAARPQA